MLSPSSRHLRHPTQSMACRTTLEVASPCQIAHTAHVCIASFDWLTPFTCPFDSIWQEWTQQRGEKETFGSSAPVRNFKDLVHAWSTLLLQHSGGERASLARVYLDLEEESEMSAEESQKEQNCRRPKASRWRRTKTYPPHTDRLRRQSPKREKKGGSRAPPRPTTRPDLSPTASPPTPTISTHPVQALPIVAPV